MNINLPYSPTTSLEELEDHLTTNYFKKPYDRFMWWRSYTLKNKPLTSRHPFKDRILNGDFDIGSFKYEAQVVEHRMNDKWRELYRDTGRYVEETSLDRARRKRLLEDFEKDEANKLQELENAIRKANVSERQLRLNTSVDIASGRANAIADTRGAAMRASITGNPEDALAFAQSLKETNKLLEELKKY